MLTKEQIEMQSNDDDFKRSEAERIGEFRSNCSTQSPTTLRSRMDLPNGNLLYATI